jgi:hypothetical protein
MFWTRLGRLIRVLYFIRVAIITLLAMVVAGVLATASAKEFLGGLFNQEDSELGLLAVAMVAYLAGAAAVTNINLNLLYGKERFELNFDLGAHRHPILVFATGFLSSTTLMVFVCLLTDLPVWKEALLVAGGFVVAVLIGLTAKYVQLRLTDPEVTPHPPPYLIFPVYKVPVLGPAFDRVYREKPRPRARAIKKRFSALVQWFFAIFAPAGEGYFVPDRKPLTLLSGHVFAIALACLSIFVYWLIGVLKQNHLGGYRQILSVPSLAYVLLALIVACWLFGGLAFFFDRYRVPVLFAFGLLTTMTSGVPLADHFFRVQSAPPPVLKQPVEILVQYKNQTPLLISAAGGGIQASAWTTRVIAGLNQLCRQSACGARFQDSLAVMSGVSGGSVGAMHVGAAFPDFDLAAHNALRPSLDDVAWGWVNPDVWRAILPWFRDPVVDRGWALERSLEANARVGDSDMRDVYLSQWTRKLSTEQQFPVFLFNATNVEAGAPLVFATTDYHGQEEVKDVSKSFYGLYKGQYDVRVSTAVRMSASFPYVSPSARSNGLPPAYPDFHFVDGGYYDNYGIFTMLNWLNPALESNAELPKRLVVLRITSFPDDPEAKGSVHGWGYQTSAPLEAFLHVRTAAQYSESLEQLKVYEDRWKNRMTIVDLPIQYPNGLDGACRKPPLSWKLTNEQQKCLERAWETPSVRAAAGRVIQELTGGPGGSN